MAPPPIPDRWLNYKPIGEKIIGTRFVAFKVPLREEVQESVTDDIRLSCKSILQKIPNLGMIIDLTNTSRYYDRSYFTQRGIEHRKLMIPGHNIPESDKVKIFKQIVYDFLKQNTRNKKLIGVHCTHGVNRTGYLICNYMVSEMKIKPNEAIKCFEAARGHSIERQNYINHLIGRRSSNTEFARMRRQNAFRTYPKQEAVQRRYINTTENWRDYNSANSERIINHTASSGSKWQQWHYNYKRQ